MGTVLPRHQVAKQGRIGTVHQSGIPVLPFPASQALDQGGIIVLWVYVWGSILVLLEQIQVVHPLRGVNHRDGKRLLGPHVGAGSAPQ